LRRNTKHAAKQSQIRMASVYDSLGGVTSSSSRYHRAGGVSVCGCRSLWARTSIAMGQGDTSPLQYLDRGTLSRVSSDIWGVKSSQV